MSEITYFEKAGKDNTDETLDLVRGYADQENMDTVVVASTTGYTARMAAEMLGDLNLIVVTHVTGHKGQNQQEFPADLREKLESEGIKVLTTSHAFDGVNRLADEGSIGMVVRQTLRMFCEGVKVGVEIAAMAADAGLVRTDKDLLTVSGTGRGADTALVLRPAISRELFDSKVKRVLAKPL